MKLIDFLEKWSPSLTHGSNWLLGKMLKSPSLTHGSDGLFRRKFKKSIGHIIKLKEKLTHWKSRTQWKKLRHIGKVGHFGKLGSS